MLKKYEELTDEEIKKVSLMYSNHDTLAMFLYNFDEHGNYHGRQTYVPPVTKEVAHVGSFHLTKDTPAEIEEKSVEEDVKEEVVEKKEVKKPRAKSQKRK